MKIIKLMGIMSAALLAVQAHAYNCSGVAQYADGHTYSANAIVKNGNTAYQCTVGGWCTVGGPYAPGSGWAWTNAWRSLGACTTGTGTSSSSKSSSSTGTTTGSCPNWVAGKSYVTGNVVKYTNGSNYTATHDNPGYDPTISTWFWSKGGTCGKSGTSSSSGNTGSGFAAIVSEAEFNRIFPGRNSFYTYSGLVNAAKAFPGFATSGDTAVKTREAAAALANFSHETSGLLYVTEIAKGEYCGDWDNNPGTCPCEPGRWYYGRGPMQLSWNGNYCAAGAALGLDLRKNPDIVEQDATVAWKTAIWFWMTQSGAGNQTPHNAIVNGAGFGETIRSINGSLECNNRNPAQVQSRISEYNRILNILGGTAGPGAVGC